MSLEEADRIMGLSSLLFRGFQDFLAAYKPNGSFVSMKNATLNDRLGVSLSATEVSTVW